LVPQTTIVPLTLTLYSVKCKWRNGENNRTLTYNPIPYPIPNPDPNRNPDANPIPQSSP